MTDKPIPDVDGCGIYQANVKAREAELQRLQELLDDDHAAS